MGCVQSIVQGLRSIFSIEGALKIGRSPIWGAWSLKIMLVLSIDVVGRQDMSKFSDGDYGRNNTSAIGRGHIDLCVVQLEP